MAQVIPIVVLDTLVLVSCTTDRFWLIDYVNILTVDAGMMLHL